MNIQQLRTQIAALQSDTMDEDKNFLSAYDEGKFDTLTAVEALLDSLQEEEEPVSKDLEEAAYCFARKDSKEISEPAKFYCIVEDKARIFKAGAKWQKQQIMAKAIDGEVGYWNLRGLSVNVDLPLSADEGDKVKVIVIEKD